VRMASIRPGIGWFPELDDPRVRGHFYLACRTAASIRSPRTSTTQPSGTDSKLRPDARGLQKIDGYRLSSRLVAPAPKRTRTKSLQYAQSIHPSPANPNCCRSLAPATILLLSNKDLLPHDAPAVRRVTYRAFNPLDSAQADLNLAVLGSFPGIASTNLS